MIDKTIGVVVRFAAGGIRATFALNDNIVAVSENAPLHVDAPGVLANDTDADGDALAALLVSGPAHGSLTLNADGSFTYQPAQNFSGNAFVSLEVPASAYHPHEFGLLHFLMRHRGDVVSKTDILESVWDANYEGDENVVEVYVGYLRRKIDQPFGRHAIETVRGAGYRLAAGGG